MTEYLNPWFIGGDDRYPWAVKCLRERGIPVKTWGVPGMEDQASHLIDALRDADLVILPVKLFKEDVLTIAGESVEAGLLPRLLRENATLIAGSFPADLESWMQNQGIKCVSLLELESFLLSNAAVTAEGAVYLALREMDRTLFGARVLIIGWGRIGRFLADKLKAMGADVTVAVRRSSQRTELECMGYSAEETGKYTGGLRRYDLIVNTVPRQVMTKQQFGEISKDCVVMELASQPGGFPRECLGWVVSGQALPGKTAPRTAGEHLTDAIISCLMGEGRTLE